MSGWNAPHAHAVWAVFALTVTCRVSKEYDVATRSAFVFDDEQRVGVIVVRNAGNVLVSVSPR